MRKLIRKSLSAACSVAARLSPTVSSKPILPTVLLYHEVPKVRPGGINASSFDAHIEFLQRHFEIVPHTEALVARPGKRRVIITFDDGFRNNATVAAPILRKYNVPAVFFVSTRHLEAGKYLWFHQVRALAEAMPETTVRIDGKDWDFRSSRRAETNKQLWNYVTNLKPHPAAIYEILERHFPPLEELISKERLEDFYAGMSREELRALAKDPLFTIGNHTHDHPYLTRCTLDEARRQLALNSSIIEEVTGKPCEIAAYPISDYNADVLRITRELGFKSAHAVFPCVNTDPALEVPRFGLYNGSVDILRFKVALGSRARQVGLNF
jgi:peptidoglycan/xylan/chitin deacetylase (PgdA/CDA1 family)